MTSRAEEPGRQPPTGVPRLEPRLDPDEKRWLDGYVERLKDKLGPMVERVVVYGSKARGDAGPESDVDVLVVVQDYRDAAETARKLCYSDYDTSCLVDHSVVVKTTELWAEGLAMELPFPRNVEAEGIEVHPARRPAKRPPGDRPPVTRKGTQNAVRTWMKVAGENLVDLDHEIEMMKDGRLPDIGIAARPAFDTVFFAVMGWCLTQGVSVVRRKDLPDTIERHLIEPGLLDPTWNERVRKLWTAWNSEFNWPPDKDRNWSIDDTAEWAETARGIHTLAAEAIAAKGFSLDPPDPANGPAT
ncbi:MAG: nucleotidyltransferase domain-containing protein [Acidobacteria bacterium]|nr:nucleotidyltransferase domain-containing protein [Acidobacteriota bacterium]